MILLTDNDVYSVNERAETAVVLLIVLALNYLLLLLSDVILRIIGRQGAAILTRVMGIILTAFRSNSCLPDCRSVAGLHPAASPLPLANRPAAEW